MVDKQKYLGITCDPKLSWTDQCLQKDVILSKPNQFPQTGSELLITEVTNGFTCVASPFVILYQCGVPLLHNSYHYVCYVSKTEQSSDYEITSSRRKHFSLHYQHLQRLPLSNPSSY